MFLFSSQVSMQCTLSITVCTGTPCQWASLSVKQILFELGHDPYTLACKARRSFYRCGISHRSSKPYVNRSRHPLFYKTKNQNVKKAEMRREILWNDSKDSNCTKFQLFAWMITTSRKRNLNQLESCQKCAQKSIEMLVLRTNWQTWHSIVCEQNCSNSHKFDKRFWQTLNWDCSKTQILLVTLKSRNKPQQEFVQVFSEVEHLFPQVGCARSKLQCLTVPENGKLFRWMLVCG